MAILSRAFASFDVTQRFTHVHQQAAPGSLDCSFRLCIFDKG